MREAIPLPCTEAEYIAMTEAVENVLFAQRVRTLIAPGVQVEKVVVYGGNRGAAHPASNPRI